MKLGIMQPYFLPYIGYFNLINEVDCICFLDDVNYINKGWINRNFFFSKNKNLLLTVPLVKRSQNKKINEHFIFEKPLFHKHFSKILIESYSNNLAYDFVDKHNNFSKNLSIYNVEGIKFCMNYLNIKRKIIYSSDLNINLNGKDRIIEICKVLNAKFYVNLPGGRSLYKKSDFEQENIQLKFIENKSKSVFNYSILHDILSLDRNKLIEKLENYEVS